VKLTGFGLLTDENIDPAVVAFLRSAGFDVADVVERGWHGRPDAYLLDAAFAEQRVVVTHDADFGRLAILGRQDLIGVIYLRPGHIDPSFTINTLRGLLASELEVASPFILVAKRTGDRIAVRIRPLGSN
jgi:predicted nuclease of predicted toxin-antitoxin system